MSIRSVLPQSALMTSLLLVAPAFAVTVQSVDNVLPDGSAFLWVEGESAIIDPDSGFVRVSADDPIQTIAETADGDEVILGGQDVLPEDTNASNGGALFFQLGAGGTTNWQVEFAIPATYYLYTHWSVYNRDNNSNYGNEDSFYVPPAFNLNARDDWIGYEGVDVATGEPKTGDSDRDGYIDGFPTFAQNWVSEGVVESHNSTDEEFFEGQFHWYWLEKANDMNEDNAFVSFDGHAIQYDVSEEDVGNVLDFQIGYREPYGVIDGFLFSTSPTLLEDFSQEQMDEFFLAAEGQELVGDFDGSGAIDLADVNLLNGKIAAGDNDANFDLTGDGDVNTVDLVNWVKDIRMTWFGDANLDGEFNSGDLVAVFGAGKYDVDADAGWNEGDWNGDLRFDSGDLVAAFSDGGFEVGPVGSQAVPEPSAIALLLIGMGVAIRRRI